MVPEHDLNSYEALHAARGLKPWRGALHCPGLAVSHTHALAHPFAHSLTHR